MLKVDHLGRLATILMLRMEHNRLLLSDLGEEGLDTLSAGDAAILTNPGV